MSKHRLPTEAEVRAAVADLFQRERSPTKAANTASAWGVNWEDRGYQTLSNAIDDQIAKEISTRVLD